jgi:hypothetical protein
VTSVDKPIGIARWRVPVRGRGPHGVEVHADLLSEVLVMLKAAGIHESEILGPPERLDAMRRPHVRMSIGALEAMTRQEPVA